MTVFPESDKKESTFNFDYIFPSESAQEVIFNETAEPMVESVLQGFNGTIFTYGQTSSGKTFTMTGVIDHPELEGITPRIAKLIFDKIEQQDENLEFAVKVSMLEIYMERVRVLF